MISEKQTIRRIKLLPDTLINRIAAGEVVERPSAVLKELLENSLDAGADRIDIEIGGGGKKLIRVRDNGRGMDREDLMMCVERHATSKLDPDDDLIRIGTLGFRGEALPSIGSVSRLTITSATESGPGHEIVIDRGIWRGLNEVAANRGATVEVAKLFYNVPARAKFLKSNQTESSHLLDVAQCYALSREGLRLTFRDGGREILAVEGRHDFKTRVFKVMGRAAAESLQPFERQAGGLKISGWLGEPGRALRTSANLFIYVLGRPVKDRLLNRALADGYGRMLPPGHWPAAVIFIDLDPSEVDVNVHPAKAEVRFRQPGEVFSALAEAVRRTVGRAPIPTSNFNETPPWRVASRPAEYGTPLLRKLAPGPGPAETFKPPAQPSGASPPWMADEADENPADDPAPAQAPSAAPPPAPAARDEYAAQAGFEMRARAATAEEAPPPSGQAGELDPAQANFEELRALAQLYNSYILAQGSKGLYLIDQHAAHERVIFNQLKETMTREGLPSQALLFPDTSDLAPQEALAAEKLIPHLARLGFDLQPFGERTFILKSAPAILGSRDPWPALLEILSAGGSRLKSLEGAGLDEALENMAGSWLYSLACRAAIKAGDKISLEAMQRLLEDMAVTPNGAYCPHGRPAIQLIERHAIERRFDR